MQFSEGVINQIKNTLINLQNSSLHTQPYPIMLVSSNSAIPHTVPRS